MYEYANSLRDRNIKVVIAGAGGAAHLPGMIASKTVIPVIGVPISVTDLKGIDSLYSVSYTHLRAHETGRNLVCRLLLEKKIVSAHRTPDRLYEYANSLKKRNIRVVIAGAGGAAHLPGMIASKTDIPVIGVPISTTDLKGIDSLYSIVQMPKGYPVPTMAIGSPGAFNAAIFALQVLAVSDKSISQKIQDWRADTTNRVKDEPE